MRSLEVEASPVVVVKNEDTTSKLSPNKEKEEKNPWTAWKVSGLVLVLMLVGMCVVAGGWMTQKNERSVNRKMKINRMRAPDRESIQMLANSDEEEKPDLKNIQFLGKGYNIFKGNPGTRGTGPMDNGYTGAVADLTAGRGKSGYKLSSDRQYSIPVMATVEGLANCVTQSESSHVTGEQSMFAELKQTVTVKGGYTGLVFSGSFTGSVEYQKQKEAIYKDDQTFMTATARCAVYVATLSTLFNVTDEFAQAVEDLDAKTMTKKDEDDENNPYRKLVRDFGTHYLTRMVMGSLYSRTSLFSFSSYQTMSYSKLKVDATAKFEYLKATGEASSLTEAQKRAVSNFTAQRTAYFEVTRGKLPPSDGDVNTWMASSKESPYPLQFRLEPIQTALSKHHFPGDSNIDKKRKNLEGLINRLCMVKNSVVNCNSREMDRNVPVNQRKTTMVQGMQTVACPYGYTAISCGIQPLLDKVPELQWSVYQHESDHSKCVCYHAFGANCFATCVPSEMARGFSTTVSKRTKTCLQVQKCPKNSQVVGCGIIQDGFFEKTPAVYAADNTSCHCYTCQMSSCVASCATNVIRWEMGDQSGATSADREWVVKKCPTPGNIALSCGMDTRGKLGGWEKYPAFALTSYNECGAYSKQGVTTKIVCGRFNVSTTSESEKAKYMGRAVLKVTKDSTEVLKGSDEALFLNH